MTTGRKVLSRRTKWSIFWLLENKLVYMHCSKRHCSKETLFQEALSHGTLFKGDIVPRVSRDTILRRHYSNEEIFPMDTVPRKQKGNQHLSKTIIGQKFMWLSSLNNITLEQYLPWYNVSLEQFLGTSSLGKMSPWNKIDHNKCFQSKNMKVWKNYWI